MKIGVFDSGVGGLSVLGALLGARLFDHVIYYGDTARVPYGNKARDTIVKFSLEAVDFFNARGIDLLVVACNTVSATALEAMRERARFAVFGVIEAGVARARSAGLAADDEILVLATKATVASRAYDNALAAAGFTRVRSLATGLFVPMVEEGIVGGELVRAAFAHYFAGLATPRAVILGCTHFPFLSAALGEYFGGGVRLIHSGEAMVEFLRGRAELAGRLGGVGGEPKVEFHASSDVEGLKDFARRWIFEKRTLK